MNLQRSGLLYLCLLLTCAVSCSVSAEFALVVVPSKKLGDNYLGKFCQNDPRMRPVKHETQMQQFIALKIHFIRENPEQSLIISTLSLLRVINVKFLLQPHQKYYIPQ